MFCCSRKNRDEFLPEGKTASYGADQFFWETYRAVDNVEQWQEKKRNLKKNLP
jgi:hypothetical protein